MTSQTPTDVADLDPIDPHTDDEAVTDPRRRLLILITMCIALGAVIASVSGLNVAQQALAGDIGASQSQLLWIINGYTLALAALLLPIGAIGDRWGRKPVLVLGLVGFGAANTASAFATTPEMLTVLRVAAGVAAAMIMPVTLSVLTTSFPASERGKAVGIWAGVAGAGGILGLFASAAIIDNATWPWIFAVPVAMAAMALVATTFVVPHSKEHTEGGFDIAGAILSVLAIGGIVLAIQEGPERGWSDMLTSIGLVVGIVALAAFIWVELGREHPLLDVRTFSHRGLATGSVDLFVVFLVIFALFLILVQLLQAVFGYTALQAAAGLLPMAIVMMPLAAVAPAFAHRFGYRRTLVFGMLLVAAGPALLAFVVDIDLGYISVLPGILVLGAGVGIAMSPSTTAITSALPEDKQGVASALNDTVREVGGAVGIALIGSLLNSGYRSSISGKTDTLDPELAERVEEGIGGALVTAAQMGPEGADLLTAARSAYLDGMQPALLFATGLALIAAAYTAIAARHSDTELPAPEPAPTTAGPRV
ncbi:MAG: MFS transporter [Actinobacteria bacterium]|nr:MAG: MFS transporter [Actinomycetota bacterium]